MRISTKIVMALLMLNTAAAIVTASGVGADMGIDPNVGQDKQVNSVNESASSVDPSGGLGSTLFGLYTSVASTLNAIYTFVFYGPSMLKNIGVPGFWVNNLNTLLTVIVGLDVAYALTGRDL